MKLLHKFIVLVLAVLAACQSRPDPRLVHIEEILEEHPDSALMILKNVDMPEKLSEEDRELYNLLLTHALYKNYIDENDDSLIRKAAGYFEKQGDAERAAKAYFLMGKILTNGYRFGEAAVALSRGLDISRKNDVYLWEGQCARGLSQLYGKLLNSSAQLKYAEEAHEAFSKAGDDSWVDWSRLDIALAYNNIRHYEKSYSIASDLYEKVWATADSSLVEETVHLMGLVSFNLGLYDRSLEYYLKALKLNPGVLTDNDKELITVAIQNIGDESTFKDINLLSPNLGQCEVFQPSFLVMAEKGKYEEAYNLLNDYKNMQDSVFGVILTNNVSQAVGQYEDAEKQISRQKRETERLFFCLVIIVVALIVIMLYLYHRAMVHRKEAENAKSIADIESLMKDVQLQLEKERSRADKATVGSMVKPYMQMLKEKYSEANTFCDKYYQNSSKDNAGNHSSEQAGKIVGDFQNDDFLGDVEVYVDSISDNLYSSFKKEMNEVSDENKRLFLYLLVGFSNRSISVLLAQSVGSVYTKKSRLKKNISDSNSARKEEYLSVFR